MIKIEICTKREAELFMIFFNKAKNYQESSKLVTALSQINFVLFIGENTHLMLKLFCVSNQCLKKAWKIPQILIFLIFLTKNDAKKCNALLMCCINFKTKGKFINKYMKKFIQDHSKWLLETSSKKRLSYSLDMMMRLTMLKCQETIQNVYHDCG
jgi:hypothetical protein